MSGLSGVPGVERVVALVVDRVVGFVSPPVRPGVFPADDGLAESKGSGPLGMVVLELVNAGIRHLHVRVVHDSGTLPVLDGQGLPFKAQGAPFKLSVLAAEQGIGHARVDDHAIRGYLRFEGLIVAIQLHRDEGIVQHQFEDAEVAVPGHPLPGVVEVVGVVGGPEGQAADDGSRKLSRVMLPLLVGIAPDERLIQGAADQGDSLFLKILRLANIVTGNFGLQKLASFSRAQILAIEGIDGAQVDGHGIDLVPVRDEHLVLIAGEFAEAGDVLPHLGQGGVEDVRAVAMTLDAGFLI